MINSKTIWLLMMAFALIHVQFNLQSNFFFLIVTILCGLVPLEKMTWLKYAILEMGVLLISAIYHFPEWEDLETIAGITNIGAPLYIGIVAVMSILFFASLAYTVYIWITKPFIFSLFGIGLDLDKKTQIEN